MAGDACSLGELGGTKGQVLWAFSFQVPMAKSGDGSIFLRMSGFSPNLWTARI
jgi:hypothetical protein